MFQVRIITVDHYMCPPIQDLDICYSEFRKSSIKHVPVIRIFGTTPTGEKTCVHVHGVFPYICIPYDGSEPHSKLSYQLAASLDKAINIASGYSNSNTQHVYKVVLVSGIPFYGYHRNKHQYLKVYFYKPTVVKQAVSLLQNGAIMNKVYQPHEAHIPFILQFFIDFNLYGMSFIDFENVKYRRTNFPELLVKVPLDSILPETITAVSCSQYEVDVAAADILNRPSSQGDGELNNPGIAAIWEDEKRRRTLMQGKPLTIPHLHSQRPPLKPTKSELFYLRRLEVILNNVSQHADDSSGESVSNKSYAIEESLNNLALDASFVSLHTSDAYPHHNVIDTIVDEDLALRNSSFSQHSLNKSLALDHEDFELLDVLETLADTRHLNVDDDSVLGSQTVRAQPSDEDQSDDSGDDEKWQDKTVVEEEDDAMRLFDLTLPEIDENILLNNPQPCPSNFPKNDRMSQIPQLDGISDTCNRRKTKIPQVDGLNDIKKKPGRKNLGMRGGLSHGARACTSNDRYRSGGVSIFRTRNSIDSQPSTSEIIETNQQPLSLDNILSSLGKNLFAEQNVKASNHTSETPHSYLPSVPGTPLQCETNETSDMFSNIENILSQKEVTTVSTEFEPGTQSDINEPDCIFSTQSTIQNTIDQEEFDGLLPFSEVLIPPSQNATEELTPFFPVDVPLQPVIAGSTSTGCEECGGDCEKEGHCADAFINTLMSKGGEPILRGDPSLYSTHPPEKEDSFTELLTGEKKDNSTVGPTTSVEKAVRQRGPLRKSTRLNKENNKLRVSNTSVKLSDDSNLSPVRPLVGLEDPSAMFTPSSEDENEPTGIPGFTNTMYDDISNSLASPWVVSNNDTSCSDSEMNRLSGALKNGQMEEILQTGSEACLSEPPTSRREELIAFLEKQKASEQQVDTDPVTDELLHRGRKPIAGPPRLGKNMALVKMYCSTPLPVNSTVSAKQLRRQKREERARKLSLSAQKGSKGKPALHQVESIPKRHSRLFRNRFQYPTVKPCSVKLVNLTKMDIVNIAQECKLKIDEKSLLNIFNEKLSQDNAIASKKLLGRRRASVLSVSKSSILCSGRNHSHNSPQKQVILKSTGNSYSAVSDRVLMSQGPPQETIEPHVLPSARKRNRQKSSCAKQEPVLSLTLKLSQKSESDTSVIPNPRKRRGRPRKSDVNLYVKTPDPEVCREKILDEDVGDITCVINNKSRVTVEQLSTSVSSCEVTPHSPNNNSTNLNKTESSPKSGLKTGSLKFLEEIPAVVLSEDSDDDTPAETLSESTKCDKNISQPKSLKGKGLEMKLKQPSNSASEKIMSLQTTGDIRNTNSSSGNMAKDLFEPGVEVLVNLKSKLNTELRHLPGTVKATSTNLDNMHGKERERKKKSSSSPQQGGLNLESSLSSVGSKQKVKCDGVETKQRVLRSRSGCSSSDPLDMVPPSKCVSDKHKVEQLPNALKKFKIPKRDNLKANNAYSAQACSPLSDMIKEVKLVENEVEGTSIFDENSHVEEFDKLLQVGDAFTGVCSSSSVSGLSDVKRKFPEPQDHGPSKNKKMHEIAVSSDNEELPYNIDPGEVEIPKSVAHWFAQPFPAWSFWSPCKKSPRATRAHPFSPPRPVSPKVKSSQLDPPPVGQQRCM